MDRLTAIKTLMKCKGYKNYLEIGVSNGHIFFRVKSTFKIAVDPSFQFGRSRIFTKTIINPWNLYNKYFRVTSDDFFLKHAESVIGEKKIDLAFVDGMHEYEYALNDIENCLKYLDDDGVILVHDCNPLTKEASRPYKEFAVDNKVNALWNGDVWKAILYLRTRKDLNVFVLDCDHGLGVVTKSSPENTLSYTKHEIAQLSYEDLDANRVSWLNLKQPNYFHNFFKITPATKTGIK
jgi:hypothetical protein